MNNELSEYMRETVKHILELRKKIEVLGEEIMRHALSIHDLQKGTKAVTERMDIIQGDLGEMAKVSNKALNDSITKLSEMMNDEMNNEQP